MRATIVVALALSGALGAAIVFLVMRAGDREKPVGPQPGSDAQAPPELDSLRRELADLRRSVRRLDPVPGQDAALTRENVQSPPPAWVPDEPMTPEEEAKRVEEGKRKALLAADLLQDKVDSEAPDPKWSTDTAQGIRTKLASNPTVTIDRVVCRTTMCRADIVTKAGDMPLSAPQLSPDVGVVSGIALELEAKDGRVRTSVFYGREADSFPPLP